MKKFFLALFLLSFLPLLVFGEETITISTYYPAPVGVYSVLRLFPNDQPECTEKDEGTLYYDKDTHRLMICTTDYPKHYLWLAVVCGVMPSK